MTTAPPRNRITPFLAGTGHGRPPADDGRARIQQYYEHTWYDYRGLWMNAENRALHFGWWADDTTSHHDSLVRMNEELARRAGIEEGTVCLDAGCGVGGTAMWLAAERGATVVGITLVADQARRARAYAAERELGHLAGFTEGDFRHLPLANASVDVVYTQEALCHAADKAAVLAEFARVLRPGGRLVLAEYVLGEDVHQPEDLGLVQAWCDNWSMRLLSTSTELSRLAAGSGLVDVMTEDVTAAVLPSLRRLRRTAACLYPIQVVLRAARLRSDIQQENIRGSFQQWRAVRRNLWRYAMISARRPE